MRCAILHVSVRVFPLPGPASICRGTSGGWTTAGFDASILDELVGFSRVHTLVLSLIEVAEVCWLRWLLLLRHLDNSTTRRLNCGGRGRTSLPPTATAMPPPGPFDEAELFTTFEQSGKRTLLDLYNVSFFCGALDEQGKPFGDIGLDDLIDSESSRFQKMQEDIIWTGTATIKEKDRAYKYLRETQQLNCIAGVARRERPYIGPPQWEVGVEIRVKGKYYLHGFGSARYTILRD